MRIISRRDSEVLTVFSVLFIIIAATLAYLDVSVFKLNSYLTNLTLYCSVLLIYISFRILKITFFDRPTDLFKRIAESEFSAERREQFYKSLPILASLVIFMPAFSAIKSAIPLINEYRWDEYFIQLDRSIHGKDVWLILQPILGYPIITSILSFFYHLWVLLIYVGGVYFALYRAHPALRQQYFLSYFLAWAINGALLAIIFASVGPCFVEPILGRADYSPLMHYLREASLQYPVMVLEVQDALISWHQSGDHGLGRGITAMPSMHVSLAFLFFLAMRKISKLGGWLSGIFLIIIMLGSVHLGYHYAVDGYVSIIVTAAIWHLSGRWSAREGELAITTS